MVLKLTGAASALLMLVVISTAGFGADEKKLDEKKPDEKKPERKPSSANPDFFGTISAVSEDQKTVTITRKSKKKGEDEKKDFTIDEQTEVIVTAEEKKLKAGLFGGVWLREGSDSVASKVKAFESRKKKAEKSEKPAKPAG